MEKELLKLHSRIDTTEDWIKILANNAIDVNKVTKDVVNKVRKCDRDNTLALLSTCVLCACIWITDAKVKSLCERIKVLEAGEKKEC